MNITKQKKKTRKSNKLDDSCIHSKVRLTNQSAFTLIEMIIVMAVIGVLVLLAAPKFIGYTEQAKLTRDMHLAKTIENSTEAFLLEGGKIEDHLETIQDYHLKNSAKKRMLINNAGYVAEEIITPDVYYEVTHEFLSEILKIKVENETFDKFMLTAEANAKYPIAAYVTIGGKAFVDRTKSLQTNDVEEEPVITDCTITPEPDYLFEAATGTIVKYLGTSIHVVIPSSFLVDGKCYPVRIIGKEAFMGKGIVTVKIPDSVKVVDDSAFENNQLESVVIPEGVEEIKDEAFKDNNLGPNLKPNEEGYTPDTVPTGPGGGVYLPNDSLENIDKGAFENNDIEKVEIPNSVINVGDNALKDNNISSVDIPGGTIVGNDIMAGNKSPNITIPDGVTVIPKNTFKGAGIVSVVFPEGLERIEAYAFAYNQIIAVNLPSSLQFIGEYAFAYNKIGESGTIKNITYKGTEYISNVDGDGDITIGGKKQTLLNGLTLENNIFIVNIDNSSGGGGAGGELRVVGKVSVSNSRSTAILDSDGNIWTFGLNSEGILGDGTTVSRVAPSRILTDVIDVELGWAFGMALKSNGTVLVWGDGLSGQMGNGERNDSNTPIPVPNLTNVIDIHAGDSTAFAVKNDGTVWAWGANYDGQSGTGSSNTRLLVPTKIANLSGVTEVVGTGLYSYALTDDGKIFAWGDNTYGQLGDGTSTFRTTPVQVQGVHGYKSLVVGGEAAMIVTNDDTVWAWGRNDNGKLGSGSSTNIKTPTLIENLSNVSSVSIGTNHTIILKNDGKVFGIGGNSDGQLAQGIYDYNDAYVPKELVLPSGSYATYVKAGNRHTFIATNDGKVFACGGNNLREFGGEPVGSRVGRLYEISELFNLEKAITTTGVSSAANSFMIKKDGSVWAWGLNNYGQLGVGTFGTPVPNPIQITSPDGIPFNLK